VDQTALQGIPERATVLIDLGRPGEALALLGPAVAQDPGNAHLLGLVARANLSAGRFPEAEQAARAMLLSAPESEWGLRLLSAALRHQEKRVREAVRVARRAVAVAPDLHVTHLALAQALAASSLAPNRRSARGPALEAARLAPGSTAPHLVLAKVAYDNNQRKRAVRHVEDALAIDPTNADILLTRARYAGDSAEKVAITRSVGRMGSSAGAAMGHLELVAVRRLVVAALVVLLPLAALVGWALHGVPHPTLVGCAVLATVTLPGAVLVGSGVRPVAARWASARPTGWLLDRRVAMGRSAPVWRRVVVGVALSLYLGAAGAAAAVAAVPADPPARSTANRTVDYRYGDGTLVSFDPTSPRDDDPADPWFLLPIGGVIAVSAWVGAQIYVRDPWSHR
jgi:Flp pilus assembly protein TadD